MLAPTVHRSIRFTIDYPPLILAPGARVELFPDPSHEYPHADDEFTPVVEATVISTDVHQNNCDFVWGYLVRADDDDRVRLVKGFRRILGAYPQEH